MSTRLKTALVMAGGTGGHIFPGLAVAQALRAHGWRVHWLGGSGSVERPSMESQLVSLWNVNDAATERLMGEYYRRLQQGEGRAGALARRQRARRARDMIRSEPELGEEGAHVGRGPVGQPPALRRS